VSSTPDEFLDSNILVYAFTTDARAPVAQALLERGGIISVQVLNEFANVARRKLGMSWEEARESLAAIRTLCPTILPVDIETHADGLEIAERQGYGIFDALIIASALRAGCRTLWSEEMQDGSVIDGRLGIANPFRTTG
jgi:predicted nucleic acid-binding protein